MRGVYGWVLFVIFLVTGGMCVAINHIDFALQYTFEIAFVSMGSFCLCAILLYNREIVGFFQSMGGKD